MSPNTPLITYKIIAMANINIMIFLLKFLYHKIKALVNSANNTNPNPITNNVNDE